MGVSRLSVILFALSGAWAFFVPLQARAVEILDASRVVDVAVPFPNKDGKGTVLFEGSSTHIVDALLASGQKNVQGLDLASLKQKFPQIKWQSPTPGEQIPDFAGSRRSAYYRTDEKSVTVVTDTSLFKQDLADLISLHEALGASGIRDEVGQVSLGLFFLSKSQNDYQREIASKFLIELKGGGGVSVGGGGDAVAMWIKMRVLGNMTSPVYMMTGMLKSALWIAIEPDYSVDADFVHVRFDKKGLPYLTFPARLYMASEAKERRDIETLVGIALRQILLNWPGADVKASITCIGAARKLDYKGINFDNLTKEMVVRFFGAEKCSVQAKP